MNEKQRTVLATFAAAMLLAVMFFVPWRLASSEEIRWAPLYRPPVTHSLTYETDLPGSRYTYPEAEIALGIYILEIVGIGLAGWVAFTVSSSTQKEEME